MIRSRLRVVLLVLLLLPALWGGAARADDPVDFALAADPEEFRGQVVECFRQLDQVMLQARRHPLLAASLEAQLGPDGAYALAPETYETLETATLEELEQLRDMFELTPGFMLLPQTLQAAFDLLPAPGEVAAPAGGRGLGDCGNGATEFTTVKSLTGVVQSLKRAKNVAELAFGIAKMINNIADAAAGEPEVIPPVCPQIPTSWVQVATAIAKGVADALLISLDFAVTELESQVTEAQQCLANCDRDRDSVPASEAPNTPDKLQGKGCDNRDNDCNQSIDESAEDRVAPILTIDGSLTQQCYPKSAVADAAIDLAVKATDDCYPVTPSYMVNRAGCLWTVVAEAGDGASNMALGNALLIVDEIPPTITRGTLNTCYGGLAAAQSALLGSWLVSDSCTVQPEISVSSVVKECVADLQLEAVDGCGNVSRDSTSLRIDNTPPEVKIESLLIPSIDGLSCFASIGDAVSSVAEATRSGDDCTSDAALTTSTTSSGTACNLLVTSTAADQCNNVTTTQTADSLLVRVDTEPPAVTCSVAQGVLWPADIQFHDVGLNIVATDNCDGPNPTVDVSVTSDEPTELAWNSINVGDPHPDAVIERNPDGSVSGVLLRAQRRGASPDTIEDGRVYRIRVVATDSCGLSSYADCFVQVPLDLPELSGVGRAVNSGQHFDATRVN